MKKIMQSKIIVYLLLGLLYILREFLDIVQAVLNFDYKKNKKYLFLGMTIIYASMIFYLSSLTNIQVPAEIFTNPHFIKLYYFLESNDLKFAINILGYSFLQRDKIAHIFIYFGFGLLLNLTFRNSERSLFQKYAAIFAIITGVLYGITDEMHQSFVPGRVASTADLFADGIGVILAQAFIIFLILASHLIRRNRNYPKQN
ncbi:VanZ family protein [Methanolobus sp. WCC4]|uniref:VanZ family protein n=1 Tax=Methanolobus sp. WCC4 TaxID=3125784 RepID=UPI0030F9F74F